MLDWLFGAPAPIEEPPADLPADTLIFYAPTPPAGLLGRMADAGRFRHDDAPTEDDTDESEAADA